MTNPAINMTKKTTVKMSKYFSIFSAICLPKNLRKKAMRKNLAGLPIIEANIKVRKLILNKPALIVMTL